MVRTTFAALLAAILVSVSPAFAADHEWITKDPRYVRARDGAHCCGSDHCKPRSPGFARETSRGWYVPSTGQLFVDGAKGLYYSERAEPWACMDGEEVGCLFVNPGGA